MQNLPASGSLVAQILGFKDSKVVDDGSVPGVSPGCRTMAQAHLLDLYLPGNIAFMITSEAVGDA
ncbi:MAG: hypothetical protein CMQ11_12020 [Gammaproteobacteria bacterium]|nr:hypothetical protein [Gammaproteobacteria bacterium]